jgi:hypothetical protein
VASARRLWTGGPLRGWANTPPAFAAVEAERQRLIKLAEDERRSAEIVNELRHSRERLQVGAGGGRWARACGWLGIEGSSLGGTPLLLLQAAAAAFCCCCCRAPRAI